MEPTTSYVLSFIILLTVMLVPSSMTQSAVKSPWYECIKSSITPPKVVFPIVWTLLYVTLGIGLSQALLLRESYEKTLLLGLYALNLGLNMAWSWVFFGQRDVVLALFLLCNLIVSAAFILYYTYVLSPVWLVWLLLPYFAWLNFAGVLNFLSVLKLDACGATRPL